MPTSSDAACRLMVRSPISSTSPNGMTAKAAMAGITASTGASVCSRRSAPAGRTSSLSRNLIGSATSVLIRPWPANPKMAARLAPMRSWMMALTLRSKNTPRPITCSAISRMTTAFRQAISDVDAHDDVLRLRWWRRTGREGIERRLGSRFSWYSALFTCITGAVPQLARHSTCSSEN